MIPPPPPQQQDTPTNNVHFDTGMLRTPGYIDLRRMTFTLFQKSYHTIEHDHNHQKFNQTTAPTMDDNDNTATRTTTTTAEKMNEITGMTEKAILDVALFHVPTNCSSSSSLSDRDRRSRWCDWSTLGIGKKHTIMDHKKKNEWNHNKSKIESAQQPTQEYFWCCTIEMIHYGYCTNTSLDRILIDFNLYRGRLFPVSFFDNDDDNNNNMESNFTQQTVNIPNSIIEQSTSGLYVLLFVNCNTDRM
jgi:hypothetical protein